MADELDLDALDSDINKTNKVEERIRDLSQKVKTASKERDDKDTLLRQRETENATLTRERDFFASFADSASKYPAARDHKDEIKSKVLAGYDVEDATISVLAKAGKLTSGAPAQPQPPKENPAGGSAANVSPGKGDKALKDMSREEKREALIQAEQRGDLTAG